MRSFSAIRRTKAGKKVIAIPKPRWITSSATADLVIILSSGKGNQK